jgi:CxxC motif-containing protein (DUF1111 family)
MRVAATTVVALTLVARYADSPARGPQTPFTVTSVITRGLSPRLADEFRAGAALFSKVWSPADGLGPLINAQACIACHSDPRPGGTTTDRNNFVLFSPEVHDSSGGHAFARFEVFPTRPTRPRPLPRLASLRRPPALFGLGVLEAVPQPPEARRSDGPARGRFGLKGRFRTIDEAVAAAFANELGLTSPHTSPDGRSDLGPEVVRLVSQFIRLLPPPAPVTPVAEGLEIFKTAGCAACHLPMLRTGPSAIPTLQDQIIAPYSDLLLHDLGERLSDRWDDGGARGAEFRTPPLWGLRTNGPPYLHDGRATTLEMAIEMHGGEAEPARSAFQGLPNRQREQLLRFVRGL